MDVHCVSLWVRSSARLERLHDTQKVGGSSPPEPTRVHNRRLPHSKAKRAGYLHDTQEVAPPLGGTPPTTSQSGVIKMQGSKGTSETNPKGAVERQSLRAGAGVTGAQDASPPPPTRVRRSETGVCMPARQSPKDVGGRIQARAPESTVNNTKNFQRNIEDFTCGSCGARISGNGYTNHCPRCLWCKHVDIQPGDRQESCAGLMEPVGTVMDHGRTVLVHQCTACNMTRKNKISKDDNIDVLIELSAKPISVR